MAEPPACQEHGSCGHNSQDVEVTYTPTSNAQKKKMRPICAVEYNSAIKKGGGGGILTPVTARKKLEIIVLSEMSQAQARYQVSRLTYGI